MKSHLFNLLLAILCLSLVMCTHEAEPPIDKKTGTTGTSGVPCDPDTIYFANTILPMINSCCAMSGCHDKTSSQEGVILDNYESILKEVRPGKGSNSKLYKQLFKSGEDRMPPPPNSPFSTEQKELVKKWIDQGALNNTCTETDCDTSSVTYFTSVLPILKNNCLGCHSASTANNSGGGIRLDTHNELKKRVDDGLFYKSIIHAPGVRPMPEGLTQTMDTCKIRTIKIWIDAGAPNN